MPAIGNADKLLPVGAFREAKRKNPMPVAEMICHENYAGIFMGKGCFQVLIIPQFFRRKGQITAGKEPFCFTQSKDRAVFYDFMDFGEGNPLIREKIGQKIAQTNGMAVIFCSVGKVAAAGPSAIQIRQGIFLFCGRNGLQKSGFSAE